MISNTEIMTKTLNITNGGGYFPWLDAARFIAAFMVLLSHSRNDFFLPYGELDPSQQGVMTFLYYFTCRLGHEAVLAFFVISGFLVGGRGLERMMNKNFDKVQYAIDRTARIGIPLFAALVFCIITYEIIGQEYSLWVAFCNLFSLQGILCESLISPLWSLSYEVWFYVFLFAISLGLERKKMALLLLPLCVLVFTQLDAMYFLVWMMGAFAYLCRPAQGSKSIAAISFVAILVTLVLSIMSSDSHSISLPWKPDYRVMEVFVSIAICVFIQQIILFAPKNRLAVKINSAFSYLADFSYTLYLTHRITLLLIFGFLYDKGKAEFTPVTVMQHISIIVICLIVSWLIYLISEKHTKTVKNIIKKRMGSTQIINN